MILAVTYDNEQIFQHFGHSEAFKLYFIENGLIVNSKVVPTNCGGHGALAGFLVENKVDAIICGGIGLGAQKALSFRGIKIYAGVSGSCDEAVNKLLNKTLKFSTGANCDHHDHECSSHDCGSHCH